MDKLRRTKASKNRKPAFDVARLSILEGLPGLLQGNVPKLLKRSPTCAILERKLMQAGRQTLIAHLAANRGMQIRGIGYTRPAPTAHNQVPLIAQ